MMPWFCTVFVLLFLSKGVVLGQHRAAPYNPAGRVESISDHDILPHHNMCEPITITLCKDIAYNQTMMPNLLGHERQEEAGLEVHQFYPLVKYNCSADLHIFLCSVYVPVCTILPEILPPCRGMCLSAKRGCETIMNKFGFQWPESLNCNKFPIGSQNEMCVGNNASAAGMTTPPTRYSNQNLGMDFQCPVYFQTPKRVEYELRVGGAVVENCAAPCDGMFFSSEETAFSRKLLGIVAAACLAPTLFTVATFLLDMSRFQYPERPIIFISLCYFFISCCYVVGFSQGTSVACDQPYDPPFYLQEERDRMISAITQGVDRELCTILFMVMYFFTMAASIWWVVLTLTWFLMAGLKWSHEAVENYAAWFHVAAWAVPSVKTIVILATENVEGDVLTGACYVGLWNVATMRGFVLAPLFLYLVLGTVFLFVGFVSLFRVRTIIKRSGTKTDKMARFVVRIGVFSFLYSVPAWIVVACLIYEQQYHNEWMLGWQQEKCRLKEEPWLRYGISCPPGDDHMMNPPLIFFLIKYLSSLIVGITAGFWVWSGKTLMIWKNCYYSCLGRRSESYV
uniref:Frizzled-2-like n=1 Tax=Hirondellea gigas TaxID=1518452 RepID=A0A6A7FYU5_9CRUS